MGMFDTFYGWVHCGHCEELTRGEIQFKWLDRTLTDYSIGDYVGGSDVFSVLEHDEVSCSKCEKTFIAYVLGKEGYVYGWCNQQQLETIKPQLVESDKAFVTFNISKELLETNMELVLRKLTEAYRNNPTKTNHVLTEDVVDELFLSQHVCRIPSSVEHPHNRLNVGDGCFYDNRTHMRPLWELKDKHAKVIARFFNDSTQLYVYDIVFDDGEVVRNIEEGKLVNVFGRDKIVKQILENKQDVLDYYELKNKERNEQEERQFSLRNFRLSYHYKVLIEQMIASGEIVEKT